MVRAKLPVPWSDPKTYQGSAYSSASEAAQTIADAVVAAGLHHYEATYLERIDQRQATEGARGCKSAWWIAFILRKE